MTENKITVQYDTELWNEFQAVQSKVITARAKSKKWTISSLMCFAIVLVVLVTNGSPLISIPAFFLGWSCLSVAILPRRKIEKRYKRLVGELSDSEVIIQT